MGTGYGSVFDGGCAVLSETEGIFHKGGQALYQALYRKYRPQTFEDVVGQTAITQTLKNQVMSQKLSHAYLFTGTRGTGKTTCAKILAKAVNCEHPVDGSPCGVCDACRGIESGSVMDVQEIDAASNSGIDQVRVIRDEAVYPPAEVKKRVYIIDEVHAISAGAFNALLKLIEEPPEHLMFILATTELKSIPVTILSRCQRFSFRRPTPEDITSRINYVAYQEGISLEPDAAELLGRLADGAFRDGLSLLDQCASANSGTLTVDKVYSTLGLAGQRQTVALMEAVAAQDASTALGIFGELYSAGKDPAALMGELFALCRDMLLMKTAPGAGLGMTSSVCTEQELMQLAPKFSPEELMYMVGALQETTQGFRSSVNQRVDGELCLIRMCRPGLSQDAGNLSARIGRVEAQLTAKLTELEQQLQTGTFVKSDGAPVASAAPGPAEPEEPVPEEPPEEAVNVPAVESDQAWRQVREQVLPEIDVIERTFIAQMDGTLQGDRLVLRPANGCVRELVNRPDVLRCIREKAAVVLGRPIRVQMGGSDGPAGDDLFQTLAQDARKLDISIRE